MASCGPVAVAFWKKAMGDPENKHCFECGTKMPQWASVNLSIYFCLDCSGIHRSLGVHLSFVRSLTMDKWDDMQLKKMEVGGNAALKSWFKERGLPSGLSLQEKYSSIQAEQYRQKIAALSEGRSWQAPPMSASAAPRAKPTATRSASAEDNWDDWGDSSASTASKVPDPRRSASSPGVSTISQKPKFSGSGNDERMNRFQNSTAISSSDFFNENGAGDSNIARHNSAGAWSPFNAETATDFVSSAFKSVALGTASLAYAAVDGTKNLTAKVSEQGLYSASKNVLGATASYVTPAIGYVAEGTIKILGGGGGGGACATGDETPENKYGTENPVRSGGFGAIKKSAPVPTSTLDTGRSHGGSAGSAPTKSQPKKDSWAEDWGDDWGDDSAKPKNEPKKAPAKKAAVAASKPKPKEDDDGWDADW